MRFQQKQRKINKTERQLYEFNNQHNILLAQNSLIEAVDRFTTAHKEFTRGTGLHMNRELEWSDFLNQHDKFFKTVMSRYRGRGMQLKFQTSALRKWDSMINTFRHAVKMDSQNAADNRYQQALMMLKNIAR